MERILLGTATLARAESPTLLLDRFAESGGCRIDLANVYGDGEASRIVGSWLPHLNAAAEFGLYVKGCHPPLCGPEFVQREVDRARMLLSVDSLDYFILHRDDSDVPLAAWSEALRTQLERGAVNRVGVSNWSMARFRGLQAELASSAHRLAVLSNHFSLAEMGSPIMPGCRSIERADAHRLAAGDVQVVAWAPLAGGFFAGRRHASWDSPANRERRFRATALGAARDVSATAIALAYVLAAHDSLMAAIGTSSSRHLDELMSAATIELESDELDWLEEVCRALPAGVQEVNR